MKRIAILTVMTLMGLVATASPIRYFTQSQATRTVRHLNAQNEIMIYCGYEYEIETYVLVNEVWAERINSAYYELWVFGYDAYTGEEVYMPLDLECVWLYSAGRVYNAAQFLRFHTSVRRPTLTWYVPSYNPYTRVLHRPGYVRTYHYDIHLHGWMPPAVPVGGYGPARPAPLPPYYMRQPHTPAPRPVTVWTPGVDRPRLSDKDINVRPSGNSTSSDRQSAQPGTNSRNSGAAVGGRVNSRSGSSTGTTNTRSGSSTGTTNTRSSSTGTTNTRSSGTTTNTRSSGTTTNTRSGSSTGTTNTRSGSSTGTTNTRSGSSTGTTNTRSSSTGTTNTRSSGTTTNTRSSGTTTNTRSGSSTGTTNSRSKSSIQTSNTRATGTSTTGNSPATRSNTGTPATRSRR